MKCQGCGIQDLLPRPPPQEIDCHSACLAINSCRVLPKREKAATTTSIFCLTCQIDTSNERGAAGSKPWP